MQVQEWKSLISSWREWWKSYIILLFQVIIKVNFTVAFWGCQFSSTCVYNSLRMNNKKMKKLKWSPYIVLYDKIVSGMLSLMWFVFSLYLLSIRPRVQEMFLKNQCTKSKGVINTSELLWFLPSFSAKFCDSQNCCCLLIYLTFAVW